MNGGATSRVSKGILVFMLLIVWAIWAPIGFFLWIPLLIRVTFVFAGLVVHSVVSRRNPRGLRDHLEEAIDFWFFGFRTARDTVFHPDRIINEATAPPKAHLILLHSLWALAVWLVGSWLFVPQSLHRLFNATGTYFQGRQDMLPVIAILVGALLVAVSFALGRSFQKASGSAEINKQVTEQAGSRSGEA